MIVPFDSDLATMTDEAIRDGYRAAGFDNGYADAVIATVRGGQGEFVTVD